MKDNITIKDLLSYPVEYIREILNVYLYRNEFFWHKEGKGDILLVCHIDVASSAREYPKRICHDKEYNLLWSPEGLGADDRAGVFACLLFATKGYPVLFCDYEEVGGDGADKAVEKIGEELKKYKFFLELDRRGKQDCIFYNGEHKSFRKYIESFGYKESLGTFSDVSILGSRLEKASANVSIGYFNEHSKSEYLNLTYMNESISKVKKILESEIPSNVKLKVKKLDWYTSPYEWYGYGHEYDYSKYKEIYEKYFGKEKAQEKYKEKEKEIYKKYYPLKGEKTVEVKDTEKIDEDDDDEDDDIKDWIW